MKGKLEEHILNWKEEFIQFQDTDKKELLVVKTVLEVKLQDRAIVLNPPLPEARAFWYKKFHEQVEIICGVKKVSHASYDKLSKENMDKK